MQPPEEMMTQAFLPAMRQLVAIKLRSRGLSQSRISGLLGITQASVSLYLSSDAGRAYGLLSKFSMSKDSADRNSSLIAEAVSRSPLDGVTALESLWTRTLGTGAGCAYHRELYPSLAGCDMCIKAYGASTSARSEAVADVSEAVRMLENAPRFVAVMPEVSVNLARAAGEATSESDVVAVPGRIVKVRGRAKALLPPEAGASAHLSRVLILARERRPELTACINLRYDGRMGKALKKLGLRTLTIGSHARGGAPDPTARAIEAKLASTTGDFDAIIDVGGGGIEPNVYLFARSARQVAEAALRLASAYSAA